MISFKLITKKWLLLALSGTFITSAFSQNVGVGTATPTELLHVKTGNVFVDGGELLFNTAGSDTKIYESGSNLRADVLANLHLRTGSNYDVTFGTITGGSYAKFEGNNGSLGIGTTTPTEKIDVVGNIKSTGIIMPTGAAAGRVLTSDAVGNASWQPASGGADTDWMVSGSDVTNTTNDIGVGTAFPVAHMEIVTDDAKGNAVSLKVDKDITTLIGTQRGIEIDLNRANGGTTNGMEIDLTSTTSSSGIANGMDISVNSQNTSAQTEGLDVHVNRTGGIGSSPTIGFRVQSDNNTTAGNVYGVLSEVCGTGGTMYGVYSSQKSLCTTGGTYYAGFFDGDVFTTGNYLPSDANLKLNFQPAANDVLERLKSLEVKSYEYNHARYNEMSLPEGRQTGFIAQDLQNAFPELVKKQKHPGQMPEEGYNGENGSADETEFLGVNYAGMVPYLVKALQEQQTQIEAMQLEIGRLKKQ